MSHPAEAEPEHRECIKKGALAVSEKGHPSKTHCQSTILLTASALLASYRPAHRAASINPAEALRAD
jgi:hypothetical protein